MTIWALPVRVIRDRLLPGNSDAVGWGEPWELPFKKISTDDYNACQHVDITVYIFIILYSQMFNHPQKNPTPLQSPVCNIADTAIRVCSANVNSH